MVGRRMTAQEVVAEIRKDRIFYEDSGGGVTFSGGEPLAQAAFLRSLLAACRALGIHTAVDTCGFAAWEDLAEVAGLCDLVLYDLKIMDDAQHRRFTGVSNAAIIENLRKLGQVHPNIWIRIPVIPGLNDTAEELQPMARLAASIPGVRQVNLLPYHRTAIGKFKRLGQPYELADLTPPSAELMEEAAGRFYTLGLRVRVGG